jgi:hypothetical protein
MGHVGMDFKRRQREGISKRLRISHMRLIGGSLPAGRQACQKTANSFQRLVFSYIK